MVFGFFKKLFGGGSCCATGGDAGPAAAPRPRTTGGKDADLEGFVSYVVRSLVDEPEAVKITTSDDNGVKVIQVECRKPDIGKIIGKSGKTISAIRTLASSASGRAGQKVDVRILE